MKVLAVLPCALAAVDDSALLLSLKVQTQLESGVDQLLDSVGSRNVTQMASLLQNLVEETVSNGLSELDSDIKTALDLIKKELLGDIRSSLAEAHCYSQGQQHLNMQCFEGCEAKRCAGSDSCGDRCDGMEHKKCRDQLFIFYQDHITKCRDLDHFVYTAISPCPPHFDKGCCYLPHTTWNCQGPCKNTIQHLQVDAQIGAWLQKQITKFEQTYESWQLLYHQCRDSYRVYVEKDAECDCKQAECETRNCEWDTCHYVNCHDTYQRCWAQCEAAVGAEWCKSECLEKDRKIDWSATEKIECYVNVLLEAPTRDQLVATCGTEDCFNQYREIMYKNCNDICPQVDYEALGLESLKDKNGDCKPYDSMVAIIESWGDFHRREYREGVLGGRLNPGEIKDQNTHQGEDQDVTGEGKAAVTTRHRAADGSDRKVRCTSHLDIDYVLPPCCNLCEVLPSPPCEGGGDYSLGWDETKYMWLFYGQYGFLSDKEIAGFDYDKCYESAGEHTYEYAYNLCECITCPPKPYAPPAACTERKGCRVENYPATGAWTSAWCDGLNNYPYFQHFLIDATTRQASRHVTLDQACAKIDDEAIESWRSGTKWLIETIYFGPDGKAHPAQPANIPDEIREVDSHFVEEVVEFVADVVNDAADFVKDLVNFFR